MGTPLKSRVGSTCLVLFFFINPIGAYQFGLGSHHDFVRTYPKPETSTTLHLS